MTDILQSGLGKYKLIKQGIYVSRQRYDQFVVPSKDASSLS